MTASEVQRRQEEWNRKVDEAFDRLLEPIVNRMLEILEKEYERI